MVPLKYHRECIRIPALQLLHHTLVIERLEIRIRNAVVVIAGTHVWRSKRPMGRAVYITERRQETRGKFVFLGGTRCPSRRYTKDEYRASDT